MLTIGVNHGEEVEVVLVNEGLHFGRVGVLGEELVCEVFHGLHVHDHQSNHTSLGWEEEGRTLLVIHSLACTFPWKSTAGFEPLPPLPKM